LKRMNMRVKRMIERVMTKYYQCRYAYFYKGRRGLIDELLGRL